MCNKNEKQREEQSAGTGIAEERFDQWSMPLLWHSYALQSRFQHNIRDLQVQQPPTSQQPSQELPSSSGDTKDGEIYDDNEYDFDLRGNMNTYNNIIVSVKIKFKFYFHRTIVVN